MLKEIEKKRRRSFAAWCSGSKTLVFLHLILIFRIGNVTDERSGTGEVDTDGDVVPPVRFACQGDGVEMEIRVVARRSVAMATGNWHLRDEMPTMVPCIQRQPRRRRARPSSRSSIHEEADSQRREQTVIHVDADNEMVGDEVPPYKEVRREGGLHPLGSTL
ncbi:hypothetical protein OsJ_21661 [Oryza sativa Japonica Group]|uniref:Uncharacterized protein n=1 Tax=Oryza sativa subsp. japonica TaxID=39947 RepID=B9FTQ6_ORYSJ|nr:hypothetical protein OsJ_21661 [Oryza sativa Japonica Group]